MVSSGWFDDPLGRHEKRFFSGLVWTDRVMDGQRSASDPIGNVAGRVAIRGGNATRTASAVAPARRSRREPVATPNRGNGAALLASILGLAGAVTALVVPLGFVVGALCGFVALLVAYPAYRNLTGNGETSNTLATAGLVLGGVALVTASYFGASYYSVASTVHDAFVSSPAALTADATVVGNDMVITDCYRANEGSPAATGTLVNLAAKRQAYRVTIEFRVRARTVSSSSLTVPLDPGQTGSWTVRDISASFKPESCTVVTPAAVTP